MARHFTFVTRLYSGLFETVRTGQWQPTGIPAITELAARVCRTYRTTWIVVCKNETESAIVSHRYRECRIHGIRFKIFPYRRLSKSGRVNLFVSDLLAAAAAIRSLCGKGHRIAYCDRSNIVPAALIKTLTTSRVVIRLLGVYPDQKALATRSLIRLTRLLTFACYNVHYDLAIGTQDGSGIEFFMDKLLNRRTLAEILLNGVDFKPRSVESTRNDQSIKLLFVGKLIDDKGVGELVKAAAALKTQAGAFTLDIVGKGPLEPVLRRFIDDNALRDRVFLRGSLGRDAIKEIYSSSDVYISLNKLGSLSNTVLEAMGAGLCTIILNHDPDRHTDVYTEQVIPRDVALRVDRHNLEADLVRQLGALLADPSIIAAYAARMRRFAAGFLWTWPQRISHELKLIEELTGPR